MPSTSLHDDQRSESKPSSTSHKTTILPDQHDTSASSPSQLAGHKRKASQQSPRNQQKFPEMVGGSNPHTPVMGVFARETNRSSQAAITQFKPASSSLSSVVMSREEESRTDSPSAQLASSSAPESSDVNTEESGWVQDDGQDDDQGTVDEESGIIRCICDCDDDDGFTIQCDRCLVWQHCACFGMSQASVPDEYLCEQCDPRPVNVAFAQAHQQKRRNEEARKAIMERNIKRQGGSVPASTTISTYTDSPPHSSYSQSTLDQTLPGPQGHPSPPSFGSSSNGHRARKPSQNIDLSNTQFVVPEVPASAGLPGSSKGGSGKRKGTKGSRRASGAPETPTATTPGRGALTPNTRDDRFDDMLDFADKLEAWHVEFTPVGKNIVAEPRVLESLAAAMLDWESGSPLRGSTGPNGKTVVPVEGKGSRKRSQSSSVRLDDPQVTGVTSEDAVNFEHLRQNSNDALDVGLSAVGNECVPIELQGPYLADLGCRTYVKHISEQASAGVFNNVLQCNMAADEPQRAWSASRTFSRPVMHGLFADTPIPAGAFISEYRGELYSADRYRKDPINQYASLGAVKPHVHLFPPPLNLAIDARRFGNEARFARFSCHPNAVLRPILFRQTGVVSGLRSHDGSRSHSPAIHNKFTDGSPRAASDEPELLFGIFAINDIARTHEITLGWEWDDAHIVHFLPDLVQNPFLEVQNPVEVRSPGGTKQVLSDAERHTANLVALVEKGEFPYASTEFSAKMNTVSAALLGCVLCACIGSAAAPGGGNGASANNARKQDCAIAQMLRVGQGMALLNVVMPGKSNRRSKLPDFQPLVGVRRWWHPPSMPLTPASSEREPRSPCEEPKEETANVGEDDAQTLLIADETALLQAAALDKLDMEQDPQSEEVVSAGLFGSVVAEKVEEDELIEEGASIRDEVQTQIAEEDPEIEGEEDASGADMDVDMVTEEAAEHNNAKMEVIDQNEDEEDFDALRKEEQDGVQSVERRTAIEEKLHLVQDDEVNAETPTQGEYNSDASSLTDPLSGLSDAADEDEDDERILVRDLELIEGLEDMDKKSTQDSKDDAAIVLPLKKRASRTRIKAALSPSQSESDDEQPAVVVKSSRKKSKKMAARRKANKRCGRASSDSDDSDGSVELRRPPKKRRKSSNLMDPSSPLSSLPSPGSRNSSLSPPPSVTRTSKRRAVESDQSKSEDSEDSAPIRSGSRAETTSKKKHAGKKGRSRTWEAARHVETMREKERRKAKKARDSIADLGDTESSDEEAQVLPKPADSPGKPAIKAKKPPLETPSKKAKESKPERAVETPTQKPKREVVKAKKNRRVVSDSATDESEGERTPKPRKNLVPSTGGKPPSPAGIRQRRGSLLPPVPKFDQGSGPEEPVKTGAAIPVHAESPSVSIPSAMSTNHTSTIDPAIPAPAAENTPTPVADIKQEVKEEVREEPRVKLSLAEYKKRLAQKRTSTNTSSTTDSPSPTTATAAIETKASGLSDNPLKSPISITAPELRDTTILTDSGAPARSTSPPRSKIFASVAAPTSIRSVEIPKSPPPAKAPPTDPAPSHREKGNSLVGAAASPAEERREMPPPPMTPPINHAQSSNAPLLTTPGFSTRRRSATPSAPLGLSDTIPSHALQAPPHLELGQSAFPSSGSGWNTKPSGGIPSQTSVRASGSGPSPTIKPWSAPHSSPSSTAQSSSSASFSTLRSGFIPVGSASGSASNATARVPAPSVSGAGMARPVMTPISSGVRVTSAALPSPRSMPFSPVVGATPARSPVGFNPPRAPRAFMNAGGALGAPTSANATPVGTGSGTVAIASSGANSTPVGIPKSPVTPARSSAATGANAMPAASISTSSSGVLLSSRLSDSSLMGTALPRHGQASMSPPSPAIGASSVSAANLRDFAGVPKGPASMREPREAREPREPREPPPHRERSASISYEDGPPHDYGHRSGSIDGGGSRGNAGGGVARSTGLAGRIRDPDDRDHHSSLFQGSGGSGSGERGGGGSGRVGFAPRGIGGGGGWGVRARGRGGRGRGGGSGGGSGGWGR